MHYDLIGDIHGCAETLRALLEKLGYQEFAGVYRYAGSDSPQRKVIFLGDFIDRGPGQREVLDTVRPMVSDGSALAVMGNHEFNAIAFATPDSREGGFLRTHSEKNRIQHQAFLAVYEDKPSDYAEVIEWFKTLPLWLDLGALRVVHACWDTRWMQQILDFQSGSRLLGEQMLQQSCITGTWQYQALETLLKGKEVRLPEGASFADKEGQMRHNIRVRWWDDQATTYRSAFLGPESARTTIPEDDIQGDHLLEYSHLEPPVFLGHYWFEGTPLPLAANIACLDYSVARSGGKLVAYRWNGEARLKPKSFYCVTRRED